MVLAGYTNGNWARRTMDGGDDFLAVMVGSTALPSSPGATPSLTACIVAVTALWAVVVWVLLKRRRYPPLRGKRPPDDDPDRGLEQPSNHAHIARSVFKGALTLAEECPIPGVREAAHLVSILVG